MFGHKRVHAFYVTLVCTFLFQISVAICEPTPELARKREIKMGRDAAIEIEKDAKLLKDADLLERVNHIGQLIAEVANTIPVSATYGNSDIYQFEYKFKILDDESVNAFSLPGGYIYINKGLLDYVQSDHELAGVLAHEIAHAAHHHMVYILKEQSKLDGKIALALIVGMLTKVGADDLGNLIIGAQLVRIARTSGYGRKAEKDADTTAVYYTAKAGYNPVGLLTFMERLASDRTKQPNSPPGILQTHPSPEDRCAVIHDAITAMALPINRRQVSNSTKARAKPATQDITYVMLGDQIIYEPAPTSNGLSSADRATAIAEKLNRLLDSQPALRDVAIRNDSRAILLKGETVIEILDEDTEFHQQTAREMAEQAANILRRTIWQDIIAHKYWYSKSRR